jgi:uncharacterized protein (DUF1697 family)
MPVPSSAPTSSGQQRCLAAAANVGRQEAQVPQFVVLLRGVNVGKANRVPMAAFRVLLEGQGFGDVRTLLNSGNAVFRCAASSAAGHAKAIRARLRESLGMDVLVVVKSAPDFLAAAAENPFVLPQEDHSRLLIAFAQDEGATQRLSVLQPMVHRPERFHIGNHAAYLYCAGGLLQSRAGSAVLGRLGHEVTTRNWATVLKLKAMLDGNVQR